MDILRAVFVGLATAFLVAVICAWILMLVAGAIHHEVPSVAGVVQAWSFRESFWLSVGLTVLGTYFKRYGTEKD